ncbi:MAG: hypothetical protein VX309_11530 [Pseudomonadota bacterium]|nr:hypothetical protein [Pseudomonadota bacterium]
MKKATEKILDYIAMWLIIATFAWPEILVVVGIITTATIYNIFF